MVKDLSNSFPEILRINPFSKKKKKKKKKKRKKNLKYFYNNCYRSLPNKMCFVNMTNLLCFFIISPWDRGQIGIDCRSVSRPDTSPRKNPRLTLPRRTFPRTDNSLTGHFLDGHFPTKAFPRTDISPTITYFQISAFFSEAFC